MPKENRRRLVAALIAAAVFGSGCAARSGIARGYAAPMPNQDEWRHVESIAPGSLVSGALGGGEEFEGRLTAADSNGLTLARGATLARSQIQTVRVRTERKTRGKTTLIGAAVGGAAGIALGAVVSEQIDVATRRTMPVLGVAGAGTGALVGYLMRHAKSRWELVYEAR